MALLLALAWMPIISHCLLETLSETAFTSCCAESSSESDDCTDKGCCAVEFASYQSLRNEELAPAPVISLLFVTDLPAAIDQSLPAEVSLGVLTAAPPEYTHVWQFVSRTALPVRAPSFVS